MSIRVALNHKTSYQFDRPVLLGPQTIRLRPAAHSRTPIPSYSLRVTPEHHFLNWLQDPSGNHLARVVFPGKVSRLEVSVDLIADLDVINPFDFFLESDAVETPIVYSDTLAEELSPYIAREDPGPLMREFLASINQSRRCAVEFLVDLNQRIQREIKYVVRMEPGVQACEETLKQGTGSCRDSAVLLMRLLRQLGMASRFTSGYLIQLKPDTKPLEGPAGPDKDFADLHAWAEAYLPGAGWIGLDPTSGMLAGEGHIPLACTPSPKSAAPISGTSEPCETVLGHSVSHERIQ